MLKKVVFKSGQGGVVSGGSPLAGGPLRAAKSGIAPFATAGPSRGLVTGVPRAYQGGCTLILLFSILFVFKCLKSCFASFITGVFKKASTPVPSRLRREQEQEGSYLWL
jgi:hypothetical protein